MKVLVLGGSGFVGKEFLRQALEHGHELTYLSRNPGQGQLFESPRIQHLPGDILEVETLKTNEQFDVVVQLIGAIDPRKLHAANVVAIENNVYPLLENIKNA
ncbi:Putative NADH-flavin reductase [Chlamydia trachomatis]|nr:Putative NADH-flavin reductase [Chlamydia trachomatis]CRH91054.1 Putative NADH-flavin reductase [Chlamydia trachomatis]